MKKNQIFGVVAICLGFVLFVPLLFLAVAFTTGNKIVDAAMSTLAGSPPSNTFLDSIDGIGTSETGGIWVTMMGIGTILLLVFCVCLIVLGIVMCVKDNEKLRRFFKPTTLLAGIIAIATAIASIIYVIVINGSSEMAAMKREIAGIPGVDALGSIAPAFVIGAGTVLLIVMGIASIVFAFVTNKFNPNAKVAVNETAAVTENSTKLKPAPAKKVK